MPSSPAPICASTTPDLGWARRVLHQQLDTLSRLTAIAWRLIAPSSPASGPLSAATVFAGARNLEKALRLQVRATWALRLIDALRTRLRSELQAVENGRTPSLTGSLAADPAPSMTRNEARHPTDRTDRPEKPERPECGERPERERFGFERRASDRELAEVLKRPTAEIIALICRELGLPEDWPRLAEEACAREAGDDQRAEAPCPLAPRLPPDLPRTRAAPS
jgi:hypothetical protein